MPSHFATPLALLLSVILVAAAVGQEPAVASPEQPAAVPTLVAPPADPPQTVREQFPELFYLRDTTGRLVPVPGFHYSDFLELFRIREGLGGPPMPPPAVLESVVLRIDSRPLEPKMGSCPVEVECRVRQSRRGWAMVPLKLGQVLLESPPTHNGPGRMLVDAAPDGSGYRLWFDPPADAGDDLLHTVSLVGRLPRARSGDQESFELNLPVAVTSRVELRTLRPAAQVMLRPAAAGQVDVAAEGDESLVTITGLTGDVGIRLTAAMAPRTAERDAEVDCSSVVRIDGRMAVIAATLAMSNLPASLRQVQIGLPPLASLRRVSGDGSLVTADTTVAVATVAIDRQTDGSATIELECEHPIDATAATPLDPLGFAVQGIEPWQQRGRISLVIEGDWQATWDDSPGIRRVDPPVAGREVGFVAAFAYDAQPASLPLRIQLRRSRVVIEPEYRYDVSAARITLDAQLRVAARGASVGSVSLGLDPAWSLGSIAPASVIDASGVRVEGDRITIPFLQPLTGDTIIEIEAAREIDPAAERVAWSLPVPRADLVGPASVIVSSDSDIELLPDAEDSIGLVRQTSSSLQPNEAGRIALVYRLDAPEGTFAAARRFLPRRVEAAVAAVVTVDEREMTVAETLRLEVLHLPLEFLELLVAESVIESESLEIRQKGELLDIAQIDATDQVDAAGRPLLLLRTLLPVPLMGRGDVSLRYRVPTPVIPPEATAAVDLPLPLPAVSSTTRQIVTIEESATISVAPRGERWRRDVTGQPGGGRVWSTSKPRNILPLALAARTREAAGVTVIEAAWLRTRLFPDRREDTATYVVSPTEGQLEIILPNAAAATTIEMRLDGSPIPVQSRGEGRSLIDLSPAGGGSRLLEIRTTAPWGGTFAGLGLPWPLSLDPPTFVNDVLERQFVWEVALLADDHLVGMPTRWTSQQQWTRQGIGWQRTSAVSSADLTAWIGETLGRPAVTVSPTGPLPLRRSVYAGIGPPGDATAWVVPTWLIVLVASGVSLAVGLSMVYRPAWRRPSVVLGLFAAAAVAAAAIPDTTPVVAAAAVPGGILALLAAMLRRFAEPATSRWRMRPVPGAASSLTRTAAPTVSLIVAPSSGSASKATLERDGL
jgi:hypothetical protein